MLLELCIFTCKRYKLKSPFSRIRDEHVKTAQFVICAERIT